MIRSLLAGICLFATFTVPGVVAWSAAAPNLIPANYLQKTDSLGFVWDIDSNGSISQGSNCFSSAMILEINGNPFSANQSMMSPDGSEYFLMADLNGIGVTRRIKVDTKEGLVRYFETLRNTTGAQQSFNANVRVQFNTRMQTFMSDSGAMNLTTLGSKDCGFVAVRTANQQGPSALIMAASPNAKIRPTFRNEQNYRATLSYPISMAPGETVSLAYAVAQRNLPSSADAKTLAKLFAPLKSSKILADVPAAERKLLVNFRAGAAFPQGEIPTLESALEKLGIVPGATDVLAVGTDTRLKGTASCAGVEVETRFGKAAVPLEKIAAIVGGNREAKVVLRDGQVLSGKVNANGLKFTLTTGTAINLSIAVLDRLILREQPGDPQPVSSWGMVETFSGDRIAVKQDAGLRLRANTVWGACEIKPEELAGCGPTEENPLGFYVSLKSGSRFIALLDGEEIAFDTVLFGNKAVPTSEIRRVSIAMPKPANSEADDSVPVNPYVTIAGGQVLTGQIDLAELHFLSSAGVIPVPPNLLKTLQNTSEDGAASTPAFSAELWGGGTVAGTLREGVLPVRTGGTVFQVPVHDIVTAVVPSPVMPQGLRDKVAELIRQLGHPDWEKREAASRELGELGAMARVQLQEVVKQTTDAEVRRRAQGLLDTIES